MVRLSALALLGAMAVTNVSQIHAPAGGAVRAAAPAPVMLASLETGLASAPAAVEEVQAAETVTIYYSPLPSTQVASRLGFGMAYHMALVYTDRTGRGFGASSGPSDLGAPQTPRSAFDALFAMADDRPSSFGTLVSDPHNDTPFVVGSAADYYTKDRDGRPYPHAVVVRGRDLGARWRTVLATYEAVGRLHLPYSPMSQNSNSLAVTALRKIGVGPNFSRTSVFAPGAFTQLPV